jgi:hypothetical protein
MASYWEARIADGVVVGRSEGSDDGFILGGTDGVVVGRSEGSDDWRNVGCGVGVGTGTGAGTGTGTGTGTDSGQTERLLSGTAIPSVILITVAATNCIVHVGCS